MTGLWLTLAAPSWANSFTYLAPDGTVMTATPGEVKIESEVCTFVFQPCETISTEDPHFEVKNSKGLVEGSATWFTFLGTNNRVSQARSSCGYSHPTDKIICNLTWHDDPYVNYHQIQHEMSLFDGSGNCTLVSLNDTPGKQGVPTVNQVPNTDPGCSKPNVAPHP